MLAYNAVSSNSPSGTVCKSVQDVIDLLILWDLPQLCYKFQEEEVSLTALKHLTESDICQLIPKIGPRAVFRAALNEWKEQRNTLQENINLNQDEGQNKSKIQDQNEILMPIPKIIKIESNVEPRTEEVEKWVESKDQTQPETVHEWHESKEHTPVENIKEWHKSEVHTSGEKVGVGKNSTENQNTTQNCVESSLEHIEINSNNQSYVYDNDDEVISLGESDCLESNDDADIMETVEAATNGKSLPNSEPTSSSQEPKTFSMSVEDILRKNFEGRKAIKYYYVNGYLDANHRRRCVKTVISAVIEQRIRISSHNFHELAEQFVKLFPGERLDTYYVPRIGHICPRGALYNKYLNMCRHLRRDGLLEYRSANRTRYYQSKMLLNKQSAEQNKATNS